MSFYHKSNYSISISLQPRHVRLWIVECQIKRPRGQIFKKDFKLAKKKNISFHRGLIIVIRELQSFASFSNLRD